MANQFGALTDHFGLTAAGEVFVTIGELIDSSSTPIAQNRTDANDENNDVAASAYSGNTAAALSEVSCTYAIKSGTLDTADLDLGELVVGADNLVITSIGVTTSGGDWPQVVVSGTKGTETITAPTGFLNVFAMPSVSVLGIKQAQLLGFTVSEGKLTASSLSASVELAQLDSGEGEPVAHGVSGGTVEVTADFVAIDAAVAWAVGALFTETQAPGASEGQAAWHTTSAAGAAILARTASA